MFGTEFENSWIIGQDCVSYIKPKCPIDMYRYNSSDPNTTISYLSGYHDDENGGQGEWFNTTFVKEIVSIAESEGDKIGVVYTDFNFTIIENLYPSKYRHTEEYEVYQLIRNK